MKIEYAEIKKLFLIGIISSVVTIIGGEIPIGWVVNPESENEILSIIMGYGSLTNVQLASGIFFGGIAIPLQYYGYKAIGIIIKNGVNEKCGRIVDVGAKFIAFFGGTVHVICVALMFVIKMMMPLTDDIPQDVIDFALWLVLPLSAVFMTVYSVMMVAIFIVVIKGKTIFPKWAAVFNPMLAKTLIPVISAALPNKEITNAINMADMGLGSFITFVGLLVLLNKQNSSDKKTLSNLD